MYCHSPAPVSEGPPFFTIPYSFDKPVGLLIGYPFHLVVIIPESGERGTEFLEIHPDIQNDGIPACVEI